MQQELAAIGLAVSETMFLSMLRDLRSLTIERIY